MGAMKIFTIHAYVCPCGGITPPVLTLATVEVIEHLNCEFMTHNVRSSRASICFLLPESSMAVKSTLLLFGTLTP